MTNPAANRVDGSLTRFCSKAFSMALQTKGIVLSFSSPYVI